LPSCKPGAPRETRRGTGQPLDPDSLRPVPDDRNLSPPREAHTNGTPTGDRPGDWLKANVDWAEILEPHGWELTATLSDGSRRWKRPGKAERGHGATTGGGGHDVLYVFTSEAAPFQPHTSYTKLRAYALLDHGGDDSRAASAINKRRYGRIHVNGRADGVIGDALRTPKTARGGHQKGAAPFAAGGILSTTGHVTRLSEVRPEAVRWPWPGRIPLGKLTVVDGDPGLGKSTLLLALAARASRGQAMPDGSRGDLDGAIGVVILSAEDGLADTIRPRLDAAGADTARVVALTSVADAAGERLPTLVDIAVIRAAIVEAGAGLVLIDPLMAYLPGEVNSYRDQDIRRVLAPLAGLAEETGAAVVFIRHLTKGGAANPLYRGGGSIGIVGAARSALLVARDPDAPDGSRRILAVAKCNLAAEATSLAYRMEPAENGRVRVVWEGETAHTAAGLLAATNETAEERDAGSDAADFLLAALAEGERPAEEVYREAERVGVAKRTLNRAQQRVGVLVPKEGFGRDGRWLWALAAAPKDAAEAPKDATHMGWHPMARLSPLATPAVSAACTSAR
jgi:hypothetical protein